MVYSDYKRYKSPYGQLGAKMSDTQHIVHACPACHNVLYVMLNYPICICKSCGTEFILRTPQFNKEQGNETQRKPETNNKQ